MEKPSILSPLLDCLPEELKQRNQWVVWCLEEAEGKYTKIPYNARTGGNARTSVILRDEKGKVVKDEDGNEVKDMTAARKTWSTFEEVVDAFHHKKNYNEQRYSGIGYVFDAEDPYTGTDLDKCVNPETGEIAPEASQYVERLDTYSEYSPSGTGIKSIARGKLPGKSGKVGDIEMYDHSRFFTLTGHRVNDRPIADRQEQLAQMHREVFAVRDAPKPPRTPKDKASTSNQSSAKPNPSKLDDEAVIQAIRQYGNAAKFNAYMAGDFYGKPGESEVVSGLCWLVAEFTHDREQIARIVQQSAIVATGDWSYGKWDRLRDKEIDNAIHNVPLRQGFVSSVSTPEYLSPIFEGGLGALVTDLIPVPVLVDDMIPDPIRDWVLDIAHRGCFPVEFVIAPAIVALSAVVGRRMAIRPKRHDDWTVVPNLWGAVVGPPGIQKTPAVSEALKPLSRLEIDARKEYDEAVKRHEIKQVLAKARASAAADLLKAAIKKPETTEATLLQYAQDAVGGEAEEGPVCRRFTVNDATVEKLGELLKENPDGLLQFRDELTGFFKTMERQGHEADRAFYMEAWNGTSSFVYDRIGRGTTVIDSACVSLFGTIQPGPLARFLRTAASGEDADGFAPRLQILVYPDPPRTFENIDRYPDTEAKGKAFKTFYELANLSPAAYHATVPEEGEKGLPYLNFDNQAQEFFDTWRTVLEKRLREGRDTTLMLTHLAKYRSLMPSLALLFHLLDDVTGPVSLYAAKLAADWCVFLEAHARRVYQSAMDGDPEAAQRLAERIKQSLSNPFTPREVMRKGWSGLSTVEEVDRAIGLLEEKGWVKTVEVPSGSQGGRPSTHVWINPDLLSEAKQKSHTSMGKGTDKTDKTPKEAANNQDYIPESTDKTDETDEEERF